MKCIKCKGRDAEVGGRTCGVCRANCGKYKAERLARGCCINCKNPAEPGQRRCGDCIVKDRARNKAWKLRLKAEVTSHYGGSFCQCCGEARLEFLTIDHIDGGGRQHREQIGLGKTIYSWLKNNNYPDGYQTLCYNCNCAKGFYGECPHETERKERTLDAERRASLCESL